MGFTRFILSFFGSGEFPAEGRRLVDAEGQRIVLESLDGWMTLRNFRAPGKACSWQRRGFLGSLALTKLRIVAYQYKQRVINIPFDDERIQAVEFSVPRPNIFQFAWDASLFRSDWTGQIEIRYKTDRAEDVRAMLQSLVPAASRSTL